MMALELSDRFAEEAITWVDMKVRYEHRGSTKNGCDCTGLVVGVLKSLGYGRDYVVRIYPKDWNLHNGAGDYVTREIERVADEIGKSQAVRGDLVLFRFSNCIDHVGILVSKTLFVHQYVKARQVKYGVLGSTGWAKRWVKSYRLNLNKLEKLSGA